MNFQIGHPKPPFFLGRQTKSQAAKELHLSPYSVFLVQRHLRLILSRISISLGGNLRVHMANTIRDVTEAFNQESLPPYDINAIVGVSCRSNLQTRGINSWSIGRVVPIGRPR